MAIASAVERGMLISVYDEYGRQMFCVPNGNQPGDGLRGYTATTVSVRRGSLVCVYDEYGRQVSVVPGR